MLNRWEATVSGLNANGSVQEDQPKSTAIRSGRGGTAAARSEKAGTTIGAAQKDTARELGAKLSSLKGIVWVGVVMFVFGLASIFYPPLKLLIGSVMTSVAIIVGNELLILGGVAVAVGGWFLAHRHGRLQGVVDANKNGVDDRLEPPVATKG